VAACSSALAGSVVARLRRTRTAPAQERKVSG